MGSFRRTFIGALAVSAYAIPSAAHAQQTLSDCARSPVCLFGTMTGIAGFTWAAENLFSHGAVHHSSGFNAGPTNPNPLNGTSTITPPDPGPFTPPPNSPGTTPVNPTTTSPTTTTTTTTTTATDTSTSNAGDTTQVSTPPTVFVDVTDEHPVIGSHGDTPTTIFIDETPPSVPQTHNDGMNLDEQTTTPEPSTLALFATGVIGLLPIAQRKAYR